MYEADPDKPPLTPNERVIFAGFILFITALFIAETCSDYSPVKLGGLLFILFWIPLIAIHEAGHALMARALDWTVTEVVVGRGRPLYKTVVGGVPFEIRTLPVSGYIRCRPMNLRLANLKDGLIYLAGPGIELIVAALVYIHVGSDLLVQGHTEYGIIIWQSLAAAATSSAVINLLPMSNISPEGHQPTDGLGIILSFIRPKEHYDRMLTGPKE